jgi:hypothetical protein
MVNQKPLHDIWNRKYERTRFICASYVRRVLGHYDVLWMGMTGPGIDAEYQGEEEHATDLVRITAPHFCAGLVFDRAGYVTEAAPILKYMIGWHISVVERYVGRKGWTDG